MYLSKASLNAEIVTAKSSEMNICVPSTTTPGDFVSLLEKVGAEGLSIVHLSLFVDFSVSVCEHVSMLFSVFHVELFTHL